MIHGACALPTSTMEPIGAIDCNDVVPSATSGDTLLLVLTVVFVIATVVALVGVRRLTRSSPVRS